MVYTEAQNRANQKYAKTHYKRVPLDLQKTDFEKLKNAADQTGESVNGFIKNSINERITRLVSEGSIILSDSENNTDVITGKVSSITVIPEGRDYSVTIDINKTDNE